MGGLREGGSRALTFGEGVRLNDIEKSVDHVEEDPHGPGLKVSVGVVHRRRDVAEVQRLDGRRGALLLAGVHPDLRAASVPPAGLLLPAGGPPAQQQHQPPAPQHGCAQSSPRRSQQRPQHTSPAESSGGMEEALTRRTPVLNPPGSNPLSRRTVQPQPRLSRSGLRSHIFPQGSWTVLALSPGRFAVSLPPRSHLLNPARSRCRMDRLSARVCGASLSALITCAGPCEAAS